MPDNIFEVYIVVLGVAAAAMLLYYLNKWRINRHSELTKKYATKVLRRHGALLGWQVLENVPLGDDGTVADQIAIGPFGMIVACDLHQNGKVYGGLDDPQWVLARGKEEETAVKSRIDNPYLAVRRCEERVRQTLASNKVYNVPVEVIIPKTQKQVSFVTGSAQHMVTLRELRSMLTKSRYEKDNGVNPQQIAGLFTK